MPLGSTASDNNCADLTPNIARESEPPTKPQPPRDRPNTQTDNTKQWTAPQRKAHDPPPAERPPPKWPPTLPPARHQAAAAAADEPGKQTKPPRPPSPQPPLTTRLASLRLQLALVAPTPATVTTNPASATTTILATLASSTLPTTRAFP